MEPQHMFFMEKLKRLSQNHHQQHCRFHISQNFRYFNIYVFHNKTCFAFLERYEIFTSWIPDSVEQYKQMLADFFSPMAFM